MSAKQMRTILVVTCANLVTASLFGAAPAAFGQSYPSTSAASRSERLNRDDVDKLLEQARAAIKSGDLDGAETLVRRAERAGIRYPFMYFKATPSAVRRELNDAHQARGSTGASTSAQRPHSTAGNSGLLKAAPQDASNDPFLRSGAAPPWNATPPSNSSPGNTADPARMSTIDARSASAALPGGATVENPYATTPKSVYAPDANDATWSDQGPVRQAAYGEGLALNGAAPLMDASASPTSDTWTLPEAPLPGRARASGTRPSAQTDDRSATARSAAQPGASMAAKEQALARLAAARQALDAGNTGLAEQLNREASALGVPESLFLPHEDRPSLVAGDIRRAQQGGAAVQPRYGATQADLNLPAGADRYADQAGPAVNPYASPSVRQAQAGAYPPSARGERIALAPEPIELPSESPARSSSPAAMRQGPAADARSSYSRLDISAPDTMPSQSGAGVLMSQLESPGRAAEPRENAAQPARLPMPLDAATTNDAATRLDAAGAAGQVLARQLQAEVGRSQTEARRLVETEPQQALDLLKSSRQKVADAQLADEFRTQLLRRLDISLEQIQQYIEEHRSELELDQRNQAVLAEVQRERDVRAKVRQKIADMVDEFNRLRDEQRYAEMEVVARRLYEMAPDEPIAQQVWTTSKFIRREIMNRQLADLREESFYKQLHSAETSAVNPVAEDGRELVIDQKYWTEFVQGRKGSSDRNAGRNPRELEIERRLNTPVRLRYENAPLSQVMNDLSQLAGVNIHLDPRGLSQEGVPSDAPVTINLNSDISLKSALDLILAPLHLTYAIKSEVLQITSEQLRDGQLFNKVYNVADLVIPIPNFVPSNNIGLQGLINDAYATVGRGPGGFGPAGPGVLVGERGGIPGALANGNVLAQQFGQASSTGHSPQMVPIGSGPGGLGGGANADFDSLIDLIVSTVSPDTWAEGGGGTAEVRPFPTNLSLVISQTQAIHQEIADLLEQLRRLQDLQVTIEVRFIRLNDSFFERIGIDFDMNIEDRTIGTADLLPGSVWEGGRQTATVGLTTPTGLNDFPRFTGDLDIPFRQESFNLAMPAFGSPQAGLATFGFAILSDIEAFFLIEAAQGDQRTNVLNAPKVTLFNGQQAIVTDTVQMPFVVGVIPVVGEFVAAQQPVIVVLNEGTMMTIQAVVSDDRRYVRLTVVPYFTDVGDVDTFTFEGTSSSTDSSSSTDDDDDGNSESDEKNKEQTSSGVTVQLPSFQVLTVVTTVSVPDGGTVLLGGIKRLSEGRNEFGVPLLSKLPYVNRLFKNVGIGRTTDSLMMMVTPRIIIQEEEEERMGIEVQ